MYSRVHQLPSLATILASPQPTIDLRLEAFERSSQLFLKAVTAYTTRAKEEITRRRDADASRIQKDAERSKNLELEIANCKEKEVLLLKVLEREQMERKDAESSVEALKRQLASVKEKCNKVDIEIEQVKGAIAVLRKERKQEAKLLDSQSSHQKPELRGLESKLHCTVEGVQKDVLLVRFTHLDPVDIDRDFSIVIDVSTPVYKVPTSSPIIPTLPILLNELNDSREFFRFIKKVRQAFVELVRSKT
ncbi:chromosome segregation protein Spc25-domain-containing protein [Hysterangium stoloniferum]|nr:chromosome segregation protein Spc25-domain-containing protein [Hysterangium stoloniferum]